MDVRQKHERILYPVVRVRTDGVGGSGTIIYSKPDPENAGEHQTFVLTNWHVVEKAIKYKDDWDPLLKRKRKQEILSPVIVEVFEYVHLSDLVSANTHKANIVAYDQAHDLAVLLLASPKHYPQVAELLPRDEIPKIKLFTPVWTSGCSLLHDPFANRGEITYLSEIIENRLYWMCNANSIFGNSGGGVFLGETGQQIGVTARITVMQLGFGVDVQTWMGFFVPPVRLYEFFDEQELLFLYDESDTYAEAVKRREKKAEQARLLMWESLDKEGHEPFKYPQL